MLLRSFKIAYPGHSATVLTMIMVMILLSLGTWQVKRLQWKENLIATIQQNMAMDPIPLPSAIENPTGWSFRPITITGRFLPAHIFFMESRTQKSVVGFHRFVAFKRIDGSVVFVNTGWVKEKTDADIAHGKITQRGFVRLPEKGYFTPENDLVKNIWYWPDMTAMGKVANLHPVMPILIYLDPPDIKSIPNDHLQYALFWFGMTFVALLIYGLSFLQKKREAGS